jgi:hypothetical protein
MSLKAFVKADALNFKIFHLGVLMNVKFSARKDMETTSTQMLHLSSEDRRRTLRAF